MKWNLENVRILKEMRDSVNRKVNCEAANTDDDGRISIAKEQTQDIRYIQDDGRTSRHCRTI